MSLSGQRYEGVATDENAELQNMQNMVKPDFVLVYPKKENYENKAKREEFENKLEATGLIVDSNIPDIDKEHGQIYIKAPHHILKKGAEALKLRMPISDKYQKKMQSKNNSDPGLLKMLKDRFLNLMRILFCLNFDADKFPKRDHLVTAEFSLGRQFLFDVESDEFFKQSDRILIVNFILQLETFDSEQTDSVGLKKLLSEDVYSAAYPLHDKHSKEDLLDGWGNIWKFTKNQPLDHIKDYFGVKIALYFAWLGFYTDMLIPISIFGVVCVVFGALTLSSDSFAEDICDPTLNITMCPQCDKCDYWKLTEACFYSEMTLTFDNYFTVIFAIVMSVWSALYLNLWKRYSAEIVYRWGLSHLQPETYYPRPEYLMKVYKLEEKKKKKLDEIKCKITNKPEPRVPWSVKAPIRLFSAACALFWIAVLLVTMMGLLVFRISAIISEQLFADTDDSNNDFKTLGIPAVAAIIDLIAILILNKIYECVAYKLTEKEYHRTQTQFDDSLILKIYVFQFINYYSGFFYIAFIKGRIVGHPGEPNRFFGQRLEECSPGGCLMELCIQLAIVMIGDQAWGGFVEYGLPIIQKWWNSRKITAHDTNDNVPDEENQKFINEDHKLLDLDVRGLFDEYLEMVVQYGFVTLFVTAFPLAPLCALINNIIEIRGDARKFLSAYRRPVAETVKNIGVWLKIIDIIGKLAIVSNGFIIAFSSNFIPRFVYYFTADPDVDGSFLMWSLSSFNTTDFENNTAPDNPAYNVTQCYYSDFRWPHSHPNKYRKSKRFWHILAARLVFVLVYQHIIVILKLILKCIIPEKPRSLKTKILKEQWNLCGIIARHQEIAEQVTSRENLTNVP